jgi:hypothetical protein
MLRIPVDPPWIILKMTIKSIPSNTIGVHHLVNLIVGLVNLIVGGPYSFVWPYSCESQHFGS